MPGEIPLHWTLVMNLPTVGSSEEQVQGDDPLHRESDCGFFGVKEWDLISQPPEV